MYLDPPYFFPENVSKFKLLYYPEPGQPSPLRTRYPMINVHPILKVFSESYLDCFTEKKLGEFFDDPNTTFRSRTYRDIKPTNKKLRMWLHCEAEEMYSSLCVKATNYLTRNVIFRIQSLTKIQLKPGITLKECLTNEAFSQLDVIVTQTITRHVWHFIIYSLLGHSGEEWVALRPDAILPDINLSLDSCNPGIVPHAVRLAYKFDPREEQKILAVQRKRSIKVKKIHQQYLEDCRKKDKEDCFLLFKVARFVSITLGIPIDLVTVAQIEEQREAYLQSLEKDLSQREEKPASIERKNDLDEEEEVVPEQLLTELAPPPPLAKITPLTPLQILHMEVAKLKPDSDLAIKITTHDHMGRWLSENCDPTDFEDLVGGIYVKLYKNRTEEEIFFLCQVKKLFGYERILSSPYLVTRYGTRYSILNQDGVRRFGIVFTSMSTLPALVRNAKGRLQRTFVTAQCSICIGIQGNIDFLFGGKLPENEELPEAFHGMAHPINEKKSPTLSEFLQTLPYAEVRIPELYKIEGKVTFEVDDHGDFLWLIGSKGQDRITHKLLLP